MKDPTLRRRDAGLRRSYDARFRASASIFARCGVPTRRRGDSGASEGRLEKDAFIDEIGEDTTSFATTAITRRTQRSRSAGDCRPEEMLEREEVATRNHHDDALRRPGCTEA